MKNAFATNTTMIFLCLIYYSWRKIRLCFVLRRVGVPPRNHPEATALMVSAGWVIFSFPTKLYNLTDAHLQFTRHIKVHIIIIPLILLHTKHLWCPRSTVLTDWILYATLTIFNKTSMGSALLVTTDLHCTNLECSVPLTLYSTLFLELLPRVPHPLYKPSVVCSWCVS